MSETRDPEYVALVAALRGTFAPAALRALDIEMNDRRGNMTRESALGTLATAVHDAWDITYDAGELVHAEVRAFLDRVRDGASPWVAPAAPRIEPRPTPTSRHPFVTEDGDEFCLTCGDVSGGALHTEPRPAAVQSWKRHDFIADDSGVSCGQPLAGPYGGPKCGHPSDSPVHIESPPTLLRHAFTSDDAAPHWCTFSFGGILCGYSDKHARHAS